MILMNDFKRQWEMVGPSILSTVQEVGQKGWYILGEEVSNFESELSHYFGLDYAVGVGNGMDAIEIALRCLGAGPQDKVLTTPLSAFATTLAIMRIGAEPVFVDVDPRGLIDLSRVDRLLSSRSDIRFLLPVHLYGFALDLDRLESIKQKYSVQVIEDCAQSIGARFGNRLAGTVGDIAATSFYPTKNLGAMGDGGALLTNQEGLARAARCIRNYGQSSQYVHSESGLNSRLDELQAAILRKSMLPFLNDWNLRRKAISRRYLAEIQNPNLKLPELKKDIEAVWHLFPVLVQKSDRDHFINYLKSKGVASGIHYPHLIPTQKALQEYKRYEVIGELEQASLIVSHEVSLPIHPFLTENEIDHVIEACNSWRTH